MGEYWPTCHRGDIDDDAPVLPVLSTHVFQPQVRPSNHSCLHTKRWSEFPRRQEEEVPAGYVHVCLHTNFIYWHKYGHIFYSSWWVTIYPTRLTSMVFSQFFSLLIPALLITMSRRPNISTVLWKASAPATTVIRRKSLTDEPHSSSDNSSKQSTYRQCFWPVHELLTEKTKLGLNRKSMLTQLCKHLSLKRPKTSVNPYQRAYMTILEHRQVLRSWISMLGVRYQTQGHFGSALNISQTWINGDGGRK